jgi:predicted nuclease of predicted toxin-antitoxin system
LSLKLYLDDCANARTFVRLLQEAGHQVVTPAQAGIAGVADEIHFAYASANGLVLVTKNPSDFHELHQRDRNHPGVMAIYQDNDPTWDMSHADIVRAIANLETATVPLPGQFHCLNAWRY